MKKYEYKVIVRKVVGKDEEEYILNQLGDNGWELIAIKDYLNTWYYFKREKDEQV